MARPSPSIFGQIHSSRRSRRSFLKQTLFGSLALAGARFIPSSIIDSAGIVPSGKLLFFSPQEYYVFQSVAARIIGSPGNERDPFNGIPVAMRADQFLASSDPEAQSQYHQLLTVFNAPLFAFLFDFRFSSFVHMTPEDQDSYLDDWMRSGLAFRRTGFQALKRVSLSMYYTDARSWPDIGFDGQFLPEGS